MKVGDMVTLSGKQFSKSGCARSGIVVGTLSGNSNGTSVSVLWSSGELTERCPTWMLDVWQ